MLTPEYLDGLTDDILAMYDALNESTSYNAAVESTGDDALKVKLKMEFGDKSVRLKAQEADPKDFCRKTKSGAAEAAPNI